MPTQAVLYCYMRTGSYHLTSLLDSADDIVFHGELFKRDRIEVKPWLQKRLTFKSPAERDHDAESFVRELRSLTPRRCFGFKLFPQHIERVPQVKHLLYSKDWHRIILVRNPLEVYASILRAKNTRLWVVNKRMSPPEDQLRRRVRFSPETLDGFAQSYNKFLAEGEALGRLNNSFIMSYDQITSEERIADILHFLKSKATVESLTSAVVKQFNGPLHEAFFNWEELVDYVENNWPFVDMPNAQA